MYEMALIVFTCLVFVSTVVHFITSSCSDDEKDHKAARSVDAEGSETHSIRRNIMQMLGIAVPSTTSTSTQTIHRLRRTASTQTDTLPAPEEP